ncbi:hypothetical protein DIPPA_09963 [Diplonema papillatum]|nr:hypothetical protein DIPPA_09963 [Diplonema papillatum]
MRARRSASSEPCSKTTTLTALDLHATYMGSESLATINEGLARNTSLRHLALEQCNVDEQACLQIQEKLGKRQPVAPREFE